MNCPICNKELQPTDTFCPGCGFEIHILPKEVSTEIEAYERERERKYKEMMEKHSKEVEDLLEQLSLAQKELESQKKEAEAKATSDQVIKDQLTKDLEQRTEGLNQANQTAESLQKKTKQLELDLKVSKTEVEKLKEELGKAKSIDGIVRVVKKNDSGGVVGECYLPVNQGLNTYGSGVDQQKNHHTIGLRRTPIAKKHFSIEKNPSGQMLLRPLNGENITCDGRTVPEAGVAVETHHRINIGNTIEIQVSKL